MNCREFWSNLPEMRAENGRPQASPSPEQQQHLAACPACAASFERHLALAADLHAVAVDFRHLGAPACVEASLLAGFRAHSGKAPLGVHGMSRAPLFGWAAAAILLLAAAALLTGLRQPLTSQRALPAANQLVALDAADLDNAGTDFIPLPNQDQFATTDDLDLVRVEVPRSAMIAAGFAVSADRAAERVEADVLLGPDGLMRAVRFVD